MANCMVTTWPATLTTYYTWVWGSWEIRPVTDSFGISFWKRIRSDKKKLRHGRHPLIQAANRFTELTNNSATVFGTKKKTPATILKNPIKSSNFLRFSLVQCDNFILSSKFQDKWFLTKDKNIIAMEYAQLSIYGSEIRNYDNFLSHQFFPNKCFLYPWLHQI